MIKPNFFPIVCRFLNRKTCAIIIVTNFAKLPIRILGKISELSFMTNSVNDGKDFISVLPTDVNEYIEIQSELINLADFSKMEQL